MSWLKKAVILASRGGFAALVVGWVAPAGAQPARDPTLSPAAAGTSAAVGVQQANTLVSNGMAVVVRDGVPHLVVGTRLYAKGETIGAARIVRITETEVWLHEAGKLKKMPVFIGIERRAVKP
jgi:hypothetical protein